MIYRLRAARAAEAERLFETYRATVGTYVARTWGWDEPRQREKFWIYHPLHTFRVIEAEGAFAGALHTRESSSVVSIRMLFLEPGFQRLGLGTRVISDIQAYARERRKVVRLSVMRCNPARRLYGRLGFIVTAADDASLEMRWS